MIAVIADDFTGAAEIGGIGLRHGLKVVIETKSIQRCDADLLVFATDTRSLAPDHASEVMREITGKILNLKPSLIYKKLDSVLRGNISAELLAQMQVAGKQRAVIVAANPALKRIIRDGIYYIDGVPLEETNFSKDPEYPVISSSVSEIIGGSNLFTCISPDSSLPDEGLILGDVTELDDLKKWALQIDESTFPAGASGFFDALLTNREITGNENYSCAKDFGNNILYILGSTYPKSEHQLSTIESSGYLLSDMPREIYFNKDFNPSVLDHWADEIVHGLSNKRKVVVSVTHFSNAEPLLSERIKENLGVLVKKVFRKIDLNELIIEGGSTTSVILNHLNINKLYPVQELDTGVIRMKTDESRGTYITTKPGSYTWPGILWMKNDK
ncbi:MAG: four-carbon acid sugar kinase family protein [Bacteroidales bacterium]